MTRRERSYRGISPRLAVHYLGNLGGDERTAGSDADGDARVVEGDGWRATLTAETVTVGPTLSLTEVTVVFEGDDERLDPLIERFSQKAMRAGG
jgi:molybdopterin synthase sulfur carrier subunit